ncbi:transcriptional regulator, AraC family [Chthoniobacter flavus Ellin428]|uniref:Transcriptional regulator, AraC family n=1 Tax=Chthoniobacter flavus Ellin428 TaxID=497964 RepID=B4CYR5_9BACT|nr:XylR family transcriptional regulator [Chthoniobacter flavus]EDY20606.1 transcriptional regulator, AraC family [Chthoniobacter flavus Ellin428]TCO89887.1 LacI family transcriptional regulator [Chthoniobacter flavus]
MPPRKTSRRTTRPPKVALLVETSNAYARELLLGVKEYIRVHGPWNVHLSEHSRGDRPPSWLIDWDGDGVIARVENKQIARALEALRVPVVDFSSHRYLAGAPVVTTDNAAIARLAFDHFIERGFQHFAYCGVDRFAWSVARGGHFDELVRRAGLICEHYADPAGFGPDSDAETDAIAQWLRGLPAPVAVFACYDARGQQLLDACQRAGLAVPDQIAVLGVDNDSLLCELSPPPLSSVMLDTRRTGWEAADLLSRLMQGQRTKAEVHRIPPLGVFTRQSTDIHAVEDPKIARVLQIIREQACAGLTVPELLRKCPMSRRVLEQRMKEVLGRAPHEEIVRVQIRRVQDLLRTTELSLEEIAERSGFRNAQYLSVVFKREVGQPPSEFRLSGRTLPQNGGRTLPHHPRR